MPALPVLSLRTNIWTKAAFPFLREGAEVKYYDYYNPFFRDERGGTVYSLKELTKKDINDADLVVITTDHTNLDYEMIALWLGEKNLCQW